MVSSFLCFSGGNNKLATTSSHSDLYSAKKQNKNLDIQGQQLLCSFLGRTGKHRDFSSVSVSANINLIIRRRSEHGWQFLSHCSLKKLDSSVSS